MSNETTDTKLDPTAKEMVEKPEQADGRPAVDPDPTRALLEQAIEEVDVKLLAQNQLLTDQPHLRFEQEENQRLLGLQAAHQIAVRELREYDEAHADA